MDASKLLAGNRIVPVVVLEDADLAVPLAECLLEAGLRTIEVTLRTEAAIDSIDRIARAVPGIVVGAGSIRSPQHVGRVLEAGAMFGVAPGATERLLNAVDEADLPFVPGATTPSEAMSNLERGYRLQKFFPAEQAGGIPYLKAIGAVLRGLQFLPTGGINAELASDYLGLPNVSAVGGSWITPAKLLANGDFEAIGKLAQAAATLGLD